MRGQRPREPWSAVVPAHLSASAADVDAGRTRRRALALPDLRSGASGDADLAVEVTRIALEEFSPDTAERLRAAQRRAIDAEDRALAVEQPHGRGSALGRAPGEPSATHRTWWAGDVVGVLALLAALGAPGVLLATRTIGASIMQTLPAVTTVAAAMMFAVVSFTLLLRRRESLALVRTETLSSGLLFFFAWYWMLGPVFSMLRLLDESWHMVPIVCSMLVQVAAIVWMFRLARRERVVQAAHRAPPTTESSAIAASAPSAPSSPSVPSTYVERTVDDVDARLERETEAAFAAVPVTRARSLLAAELAGLQALYLDGRLAGTSAREAAERAVRRWGGSSSS